MDTLGEPEVIEAIVGPVQLFNIDISDDLPAFMVKELCRGDNNASHIAPLLQISLRRMWDTVKNKSQSRRYFDIALYQKVRPHSMDEFLNEQLKSLASLPDFDSGLIIDILYRYTTKYGTAKECSHQDIQREYAHLDPQKIKMLISRLQDKWLLIEQADEENMNSARLAHDALVPLVIDEYHHSYRPGQRAVKLIDAKVNIEGFDPSLISPDDLHIIETGKIGMRALTDEEEKRIALAKVQINEKIWKEHADNLMVRAENQENAKDYTSAIRLSEYAQWLDPDNTKAYWSIVFNYSKIRWNRELKTYNINYYKPTTFEFSKDAQYLLMGDLIKLGLYHIYSGLICVFKKGIQGNFSYDSTTIEISTTTHREIYDFKGNLIDTFLHAKPIIEHAFYMLNVRLRYHSAPNNNYTIIVYADTIALQQRIIIAKSIDDGKTIEVLCDDNIPDYEAVIYHNPNLYQHYKDSYKNYQIKFSADDSMMMVIYYPAELIKIFKFTRKSKKRYAHIEMNVKQLKDAEFIDNDNILVVKSEELLGDKIMIMDMNDNETEIDIVPANSYVSKFDFTTFPSMV